MKGNILENFERIYNAYSPAVYRLGVLYLRDKGAAEDITQDCFLKLFVKKDFASDDHIRAWLLTVARNLCINALKKNKRFVPLDDYLPAPEPVSKAVMEELYKLNSEDRAAIYLFYYEDYPTKEIAKMLKTTDAAVRARLKRARAELRDILEEETGGY
jgi:RNA polymerase sigma-70 factor (ECF subfamily)